MQRSNFEFPVEVNIKPGELWTATFKEGVWFFPKNDLWALMRHDTMLFDKVIKLAPGEIVMFLSAEILREAEYDMHPQAYEIYRQSLRGATTLTIRESIALRWLFGEKEVWSLHDAGAFENDKDLVNKVFEGDFKESFEHLVDTLAPVDHNRKKFVMMDIKRDAGLRRV